MILGDAADKEDTGVDASIPSADTRLWRRIVGLPRTTPGRFAVVLTVVILVSGIVTVRYYPHAFLPMFLLGCLEGVGFFSTLVAAGKGERSFLVFVALLFYLVLLLNFLGALIAGF
jgi:hypothetical protein